MSEVVKRYTRGDVTVVWKPSLCLHTQTCFRALPTVFDPRKHPWVHMEGAELSAIVEQVKRCPSGALALGAPAPAVEPTSARAASAVRIEPQANGPLLVRGEIEVRKPDGTIEHRSGSCALCRCGQSAHKPWCDETHSKVGFQG